MRKENMEKTCGECVLQIHRLQIVIIKINQKDEWSENLKNSEKNKKQKKIEDEYKYYMLRKQNKMMSKIQM